MATAPTLPTTTASWIALKQTDFKHGTYRITRSGRYRLAENIVFKPNPNDDFRPTAAQSAIYPTTGSEGAYRLGFFAAITIETTNVILDLNGFSLEQHPDHALQQRFFALIELADQPFIPQQGPADFGATIDAAQRVIVRNGRLGLSSHHGIHGNDNRDITIESCVFENFEVAAVSVNGARRLRIANCHVRGTRKNVPVLGVYSAARFLRPLLDTLDSSATITLRGTVYTRDQIIARLDAATTSIFRRKPIASAQFFVNTSGLTDGPVYGLLVNKEGIAVNNFACCSDERDETFSQDVTITQTKIEKIHAKPREIIALSKANARTPQTGAFGEVFPITSVTSSANTYTGTVLSDAQLLLAKHTTMTKIDPALVVWAEAGAAGNLKTTMASYNMSYVPNGDSMFHVMKGVMGVRCDGVSRLDIRSVDVAQVCNKGAIGSTKAGAYFGSRGHPKQNDDIGFGGNQARGIVLAKCWSATMRHIQICNVVSNTGSAWGIEVMNSTDLLQIDNVQMMNIHACKDDDPARQPTLPNTGCAGTGLDVHEVLKAIITRVRIRQLRGKSISYVNSPFKKVTSSPSLTFSMAYDYPNRRGWYNNRLV